MLRAVLVCLCLLASVSLAEYVLTPYGFHPRECVHFVDNDEVAGFDDVDEMFRSMYYNRKTSSIETNIFILKLEKELLIQLAQKN